MAFIIPIRKAPTALNTELELHKVDVEMASILNHMSTAKRMSPDEIIDNADQLSYLANKRKALTEIISYFSYL